MTALSGKTALVTGASRGMGRANALALAAAGAQVLVHYGRGVKEADAVVTEIRKAGGRADSIAADLATADGPHKLAKLARGIVGARLDVLVANAGISKAATIEDSTTEDFDKLFAINVRAPFFLVQQLLPIMSKGSSIVLVSSLAAHAAVGTLSGYAATKGAIDTLVKHFAAELGPRGIRVGDLRDLHSRSSRRLIMAASADRDGPRQANRPFGGGSISSPVRWLAVAMACRRGHKTLSKLYRNRCGSGHCRRALHEA